MKVNNGIILLKISALSLICTMNISCGSNAVKKGMLVVTEVQDNILAPDFLSGSSWRYLPGARLCAVNPDKPTSFNVLTGSFYSACSPDISSDGRHMLFAGQLKQGEPWQIWEMDLNDLKLREITSFNENCIDPAYLPGERLVFSKITKNDTVKMAHCLFTCDLDGSGLKQITFTPDACFATTVLKDGRLLTVSRQLQSGQGDGLLMVMRPDGTKADIFYKSEKGNILISSANETPDGKLVFIESEKNDQTAAKLVSISYKRPLHTRIDLSSGINSDIYSVLPLQPDKYLVSMRMADSGRFSLYEFDPLKKLIGQEVWTDPGYNILETVQVKEYERPKKLPSEVDREVKTGLLLCQDINFINPSLPVGPGNLTKARKIEVLGIDTTYGVVQVEEDGSFNLKVMADIPFRIRTMDEQGNVINGPCSWLWLRPNERRGCVGCHEDPELVPENRVPIAVTKAPVIIPVHITGIKEKMVELE